MSRIITIGREFGSGGREIGKRLSDELGIAYYDNEIISQIADRTKLAEGYVQHVMENGPSTLYPITIGRSFYMGVDPIMEQNNAIYREQSRLIQEFAEKSDCVIVGRSADYILREKHVPPVCLCGDGAQDGTLQEARAGERALYGQGIKAPYFRRG